MDLQNLQDIFVPPQKVYQAGLGQLLKSPGGSLTQPLSIEDIAAQAGSTIVPTGTGEGENKRLNVPGTVSVDQAVPGAGTAEPSAVHSEGGAFVDPTMANFAATRGSLESILTAPNVDPAYAARVKQGLDEMMQREMQMRMQQQMQSGGMGQAGQPGVTVHYDSMGRPSYTLQNKQAVGEFSDEHQRALRTGMAMGLQGDALNQYVLQHMQNYRAVQGAAGGYGQKAGGIGAELGQPMPGASPGQPSAAPVSTVPMSGPQGQTPAARLAGEKAAGAEVAKLEATKGMPYAFDPAADKNKVPTAKMAMGDVRRGQDLSLTHDRKFLERNPNVVLLSIPERGALDRLTSLKKSYDDMAADVENILANAPPETWANAIRVWVGRVSGASADSAVIAGLNSHAMRVTRELTGSARQNLILVDREQQAMGADPRMAKSTFATIRYQMDRILNTAIEAQLRNLPGEPDSHPDAKAPKDSLGIL